MFFSWPIFGYIFSFFIVKLHFYFKKFAVINQDRKQERRRKRIRRSLARFWKKPSENRLTAILNSKKPKSELDLPRQNAFALPLVPPPLKPGNLIWWSSCPTCRENWSSCSWLEMPNFVLLEISQISRSHCPLVRAR